MAVHAFDRSNILILALPASRRKMLLRVSVLCSVSYVTTWQVDVVVLDEASNAVVATIFSSEVLNKYSFDRFTGYSPPINVSATGLKIPNGRVLRVAFLFHNNDQNLQVPVYPLRWPV